MPEGKREAWTAALVALAQTAGNVVTGQVEQVSLSREMCTQTFMKTFGFFHQEKSKPKTYGDLPLTPLARAQP